MNRRDFIRKVAVTGAAVGLGGLGASCGGGGGGGSDAPPPSKPLERLMTGDSPPRQPNLIYIFSDEHRNCSWGAGGNPEVLTPRLDAMARQGVVFTNCISNFPLCSPHRASLLSGRYPQSHGVTTNLLPRMEMMSPESPTLASALKAKGYACGYVGKWHLQTRNEAVPTGYVPPGPYRYGFDDYWRATYGNDDRYNTFTFDEQGQEQKLLGYAPSRQTDMALEFIDMHATGPFFLALSWQPPHPPYTEAPDDFIQLYASKSISFRGNVPTEHRTQELTDFLMGYYSHMSALDREIGRVLDRLDELGIGDNTIVVYSSDHGDLLRSHGGLGKNRPWEEAINVPFVVRWPAAISGGRTFQNLFSTVDIAPTLLGLTGVGTPATMEGQDISRGNGTESVFIMGDIPDLSQIWRGVRTDRHTFVKAGPAGALAPWGLFDNLADPLQQVNLVRDPAHATTIRGLDDILSQWQTFAREG